MLNKIIYFQTDFKALFMIHITKLPEALLITNLK